MIMSDHYLIVDISNIMHMCRHQNSNETDKNLITSLTFHVVFNMLKKYHRKLKPTHMILAFDKANWRKDYTQSTDCVSGKIYKGDRNQNLTQSEKELLKHFRDSIDIFEELMRNYTGIIVFSADKCEADDLIAGFCQKYGINDKITILSSDKDYVQLLTSPNVKLMNPLKEQYRTLEEYDYDVTWHKFFKEFRAGEDGIRCALPRVRSTRLKKAYKDPFEMVNLMQETWTDQNGKEFLVEDLYNENSLLMDLEKQPPWVRKIMDNTIMDAMANSNKFSHFHFLKFCGKYDLVKISKSIELYIPMLQ